MQAVQRIDAEGFRTKIQRYLSENRLSVVVHEVTDNIIVLKGVVPTYYTRQKIQQAIMRMMPKGMRLLDEGILVGCTEDIAMN